MNANEHKHLSEKRPQRGKMWLIDSIVRVDRNTVETSTQIRPEFFGNGSKTESYLGVALIAQSVALPLIYRCEIASIDG